MKEGYLSCLGKVQSTYSVRTEREIFDVDAKSYGEAETLVGKLTDHPILAIELRTANRFYGSNNICTPLEEAVDAFLNASRSEHLIVRLNDEENDAVKLMENIRNGNRI